MTTSAFLFFLLATSALSLQTYAATATTSEHIIELHHADHDHEPCDESFPLAPASYRLGRAKIDSPDIPKFVIPADPTRRSYAPLCADGRRIDVRRLEQCDGGQCWVTKYNACYHVTSRECNVPQESPPPTRRPTFATVETEHAVKLELRDVPPGYRPSPEVRSIILRFVKETLEETLEDGFELVRVEYAGRLPPTTEDGRKLKSASNLRQRRRLETVYVPLRVTVRGKTDISDFALSYIMEKIRDHFDDLEMRLLRYVESLDGASFQNIFGNVKFSTDTYNFDNLLTAPTDSPSSEPTTGRPTARPTDKPTETPSGMPSEVAPVETATGVVISNDAEETTTPPVWVWVIVTLVILLLCCICCAVCCKRRRKKNAEKDRAAVSVHIRNDKAARPSQGRRKSSQHPQPHRPSRNAALHDGSDRSGRPPRPHPVKVRPAMVRHISQTEIEEAKREKEYNDYVNQKEPEEEGHHDGEARGHSKAIVAYSSVEDPPEENALVLHNPNRGRYSENSQSYPSEEPQGIKVHLKSSLLASDVCYDNGTIDSDQESGMQKSEDPDGAKMPKQKSMYAPVVSGDNASRKPRRSKRYPKKDEMFLCPLEELPEEVRSKTRVKADGDQPRESRKKKRKSKKKHRSAPQKTDGGDNKEGDDDSGSDSPSIRTRRPEENSGSSEGQHADHTRQSRKSRNKQRRGSSHSSKPRNEKHSTTKKSSREPRPSTRVGEEEGRRPRSSGDEDSEEEEGHRKSIGIDDL